MKKIITCIASVFLIAGFIKNMSCQDISLIKAKLVNKYIDKFNQNDTVIFPRYISNETAFSFILKNAPLIEIPDKNIEETYYFRWWAFRKHIHKTEKGYVITEFSPEVSWAGKHNTISCAAAHHIYEGRWLKNPVYVNDYIDFWLNRSGESIRKYSFWITNAAIAFHSVHPNKEVLISQLPYYVRNFIEWKKTRKDSTKTLYWQIDSKDGMEMQASGRVLKKGILEAHNSAVRPSINSYMYGEANAIAQIAQIAGEQSLSDEYDLYAKYLKYQVQERLWNKELKFFTVLPKDYTKSSTPVNIRELIGFTPWYFSMPDDTQEYAKAWEALMDTAGFYAPFGLTTCEQSHQYFQIDYNGYECQWNGPTWPYATTITLKALSNFINNYSNNNGISINDFYTLLAQYANSHFLIKENGDTVKWVDECQDPFTGDWVTRTILKNREGEPWPEKVGGHERGKDYNHSGFCDLVISDLLGIKPHIDGTIGISPLIPIDWEWFCIENLFIHGKNITVIWDKTGSKYNKGKGFIVLVDGKQKINKEQIEKTVIKL